MNSIITLAAVFLGWVLGQGAELVRNWHLDSKSIKALNTELEDIDAWFERMEKSVKYAMQLIVLKEQPSSIPSKIFVQQYLGHYSKVSHKLTREKRLLFVDIFSTIETVNELISDLKPLLSDASPEAPAHYDSKLYAIYHNARMARFKILNFHKNQLSPYHPKLNEATERFESYIADEIQEAKNSAKSQGIDQVKAHYYGRDT